MGDDQNVDIDGFPKDSDRGKIPVDNIPGMSTEEFMARFEEALLLKAAELDLRRQEQIKLQMATIDRIIGDNSWSMDAELHLRAEKISKLAAEMRLVKEGFTNLLQMLVRQEAWHVVSISEQIDRLCFTLDIDKKAVEEEHENNRRHKYSFGQRKTRTLDGI